MLKGKLNTFLTGPYLNANSIKLTFGRRPKHTVLVSPLIETRKNLVQCLQFCFNAYTVFDNARRQLEVSIEYFDKNGTSLKEEAEVLFRFKGLKEKWSIYWNYTEKNIIGKHDGFYRVSFFFISIFIFMLKFCFTFYRVLSYLDQWWL